MWLLLPYLFRSKDIGDVFLYGVIPISCKYSSLLPTETNSSTLYINHSSLL